MRAAMLPNAGADNINLSVPTPASRRPWEEAWRTLWETLNQRIKFKYQSIIKQNYVVEKYCSFDGWFHC